MKKYIVIIFISSILLFPVAFAGVISERLLLKDDWKIYPDLQLKTGGDKISSVKFKTDGWYNTAVPSTVLAALVENKVYSDPYFGVNLRSIPEDQFKYPWWFRTTFELPSDYKDKNMFLHLDGIIYRADVWINGKLIAGKEKVEGVYTLFEFNVTPYIVNNKPNCLAIKIYPPQENNLSVNFVDWNPKPPDRNMGLWKDVYITKSGHVTLKHPYVVTDLDLSSLEKAHITVSAEVTNITENIVTGILEGKIADISFLQEVTLKPNETKIITFSPKKYLQLNITNPKLWWPNLTGPQNLYNLSLEFKINGIISDSQNVNFGIREVSSFFNERGYRGFTINGKKILVRGGGWTDDMLLRHSSKVDEAKVKYTKQINFNAIRVEGIWGTDEMYDLCDKYGIMVLTGWTCQWEWLKYDTQHQLDIAASSWKEQILRLRNHPSILVWLYGSDNPPIPKVEQIYVDILNSFDKSRPFLSSASEKPTKISGNTGVKMRGPYDYVIPGYYYKNKRDGGAFGFATEEGPGAVIPQIESIIKMFPKENLWPINDAWYYHSSTRGHYQKDLNANTHGIDTQYGAATSAEDYCKKSQLMNYDANRALFESWGKNKFLSTGIISWMYNSAWPSVCWQMFDYFLLPGGAFYGARKACEPLHIQYSYDDDTIYIINGYYRNFKNLKVTAKTYNINMKEKYSAATTIDVPENSNIKALTIKRPDSLTGTYFVHLELKDDTNKLISSNFYCLSSQSPPNFSMLSELPVIKLISSYKVEKVDTDTVFRVSLENPTKHLAFFVNLTITKGKNEDTVTPIYWDDNYFSLLPKEKKEITATFPTEELSASEPFLKIDGWNIEK
ncbi:MAG: glycoside hydrolase family 2 TIM barrel-domain containing protein [Elusimicrobia bacterium]|nr:glycoside hydrolase family 2 TIM barrel-domain containing protein [Elusimicrobiota bacterium]